LVLKFILRPSSSAASALKKKADAAAAAAAAAAASAAAAADGPKKKQQRSSSSGFTSNSSRKLNEDPEVFPCSWCSHHIYFKQLLRQIERMQSAEKKAEVCIHVIFVWIDCTLQCFVMAV